MVFLRQFKETIDNGLKKKKHKDAHWNAGYNNILEKQRMPLLEKGKY